MRNRVGRITGSIVAAPKGRRRLVAVKDIIHFRMLFRTARLVTVLVVATAAAGCGGLFSQKYEYLEEIVLDVDGSAVVSLSASEAALVALRGAPLDASPHARPDRAALQE